MGRLSKQSTNWMRFPSKFQHHSPVQIGKKAKNSQRNTKEQLVKQKKNAGDSHYTQFQHLPHRHGNTDVTGTSL